MDEAKDQEETAVGFSAYLHQNRDFIRNFCKSNSAKISISSVVISCELAQDMHEHRDAHEHEVTTCPITS